MCQWWLSTQSPLRRGQAAQIYGRSKSLEKKQRPVSLVNNNSSCFLQHIAAVDTTTELFTHTHLTVAPQDPTLALNQAITKTFCIFTFSKKMAKVKIVNVGFNTHTVRFCQQFH